MSSFRQNSARGGRGRIGFGLRNCCLGGLRTGAAAAGAVSAAPAPTAGGDVAPAGVDGVTAFDVGASDVLFGDSVVILYADHCSPLDLHSIVLLVL